MAMDLKTKNIEDKRTARQTDGQTSKRNSIDKTRNLRKKIFRIKEQAGRGRRIGIFARGDISDAVITSGATSGSPAAPVGIENDAVDKVAPIVAGRNQDERQFLEFAGNFGRKLRVQETVGDLGGREGNIDWLIGLIDGFRHLHELG